MAVTPKPEQCGHCGDIELVNTQGHYLSCLRCGKLSNLDGTPIEGNAHFRANGSPTLSGAESHGIAEFQ